MRSLRWAVPIAVGAVLVLAAPAVAAEVQIQDDANVLDTTNVQNEAARLPVDVVIWTSRQPMSNGQFDTEVAQKVSSQFPIAMGINVAQKHETIQMGPVEGLSQSARISAEDSANNAFTSVMRSRTDYTGAIQAAVSSLNSSLGGRGAVNNGRSGSHGTSWGFLVIVLVVLVVVVAVLGRVFRRRFGMGAGRGYGGPPPGGYGPGGQYGPNYGPGYGPGPGYGGGGGIGRGGAAGLGALGGGLVGYELGKMSGENEQFRRDEMDGGFNQGWDNNNQGWNDNQGWGGGDQGGIVGQDSDWGNGGGGGDFGGGGGDNSGGNW